jgi:hypothetical protein
VILPLLSLIYNWLYNIAGTYFFITNYFSDRISNEKVLGLVTFRGHESRRKSFRARAFSNVRTLRTPLLGRIVQERGVHGRVYVYERLVLQGTNYQHGWWAMGLYDPWCDQRWIAISSVLLQLSDSLCKTVGYWKLSLVTAAVLLFFISGVQPSCSCGNTDTGRVFGQYVSDVTNR